MHGVLIVDKPIGPTSHDVVRSVRRALRTRAVGHAGTLDPMASGVLVLGIGEGTKLLHHLTGHDKTYLATIKLGAETDTLDAQGRVVREAAVPALTLEQVKEATRAFLGEIKQLAPVVSAIKRDGVALHERVRRGESVEAPERTVHVHAFEVLALRDSEIDVRVHCGKGCYVRSLARDLASALGTAGHLSMLRRVASGSFAIDEAVSFELVARAGEADDARAGLQARLLSLPSALRDAPQLVVDAAGLVDVRNGRAVSMERVTSGTLPADGVEPVALLDATGGLVALGRSRAGRVEITRGVFPASAAG